MSLERGLTYARPGTKAIKASVPEGIVAFLDLDATDRLNWKMDVVNGKRIAIVSAVHKKVGRKKSLKAKTKKLVC